MKLNVFQLMLVDAQVYGILNVTLIPTAPFLELKEMEIIPMSVGDVKKMGTVNYHLIW